jgi:hypothetical protein
MNGDFIYFRQHNFYIGILYVNYLLYVLDIWPSQVHAFTVDATAHPLHWPLFTVGIFYVVSLIYWGVVPPCTVKQ